MTSSIHFYKEKANSQKKTFGIGKDLEILIYPDLKEIEAQDWHSVLQTNQLFLQFSYLQTLLESPPKNMKFYFCVAYLRKKAVWVACFQSYEFASDSIHYQIKQEKSEHLVENVLQNMGNLLVNLMKKKKFTVLICGQAFVSGNYGFGFSQEISETLALKILHQTALEIAKTQKIHAILAKDFDENQKQGFGLKKENYHAFRVDPNMVLNLDKNWITFEHYLAAMSNKYRTKAKRVYKKSADLDCRELNYQEIVEFEAQIYDLYEQVHARADFKLGTLNPSYFRLLKKNMPNEFFVRGYFLNGKLLSFASYFLKKDFLEAHFVGFENETNHEYLLYPRILYDFVKLGIAANTEKIYFGRTALEIKSTVGAVAQDLVCYVKLPSCMLHKFIKPIFSHLKATEWAAHSPFKNDFENSIS
ncbi:MAG: hypothetical protein EAZ97_11895 [Bacteroidetes bacterium]|nr:MAG: hypothetical protein EAZ97_11895 [Bacteroidota bacterium]